MKKKIKDLTLVDLTKVKGLVYTPLDCLLGDQENPEDFLNKYGEIEVEVDESNTENN